MNAIMAWTGGRAPPPSQNTPTPCGGFRWPDATPAPRGSAIDALQLLAARSGPQTLIALSLPHPATQRLRRAVDLGRYRTNRRPLRGMIGPMLKYHPDRARTRL